jgi:hypothetical protein
MSKLDENFAENTNEQQVVFVPMILPMGVFRFLNEEASKSGRGVTALINEALAEKIDKLSGGKLSKGGKHGRL